MKKQIVFICLSLLIFASCKNESAQSSAIAEAEKALQAENTPKNVQAVLANYTKFIGENKDNKSQVLEYLKKGSDLAVANKQYGSAVGFLTSYIKEIDNKAERKAPIIALGNIMETLKKGHASNTLYKCFIEEYPDAQETAGFKAELEGLPASAEAYLLQLGEEIFVEPDNIGINRKASRNYVDACEAFALVSPNHAKAPEFLYKSAEMAKTLRTFPKALTIYDWLIEKYPNYENTPLCMFLKAFILENNLKNVELAKEVYADFIQKYPNHDFADDAKFSLENIGKTDAEIMQIIEERKKSQESGQ